MAITEQRLFILAGMPRTATTFLYQRFQEHPAIFCPYRKESYFFSVNHSKGLEWYQSLYADLKETQIGADVTPAYFLDEQAIDRIRAFRKDIPIVLGVRRASDWALSWYTQVLSNHIGRKPSFEEFVTGYQLEIAGGEIRQDFRNGFVRKMIERYIDSFGENLCLYHFQLLKDDPLALINSIEDFLQIPRYFNEENLKNEVVNAGTRRNIGFIAYILSQEQLVDFVGRLLPRRLVQAARNMYVKVGTTTEAVKPPSHTEEELALSREIFEEDDRWIENYFSESPVRFGGNS